VGPAQAKPTTPLGPAGAGPNIPLGLALCRT